MTEKTVSRGDFLKTVAAAFGVVAGGSLLEASRVLAEDESENKVCKGVEVTHLDGKNRVVFDKCMPEASLNGHQASHGPGESDIIGGPCGCEIVQPSKTPESSKTNEPTTKPEDTPGPQYTPTPGNIEKTPTATVWTNNGTAQPKDTGGVPMGTEVPLDKLGIATLALASLAVWGREVISKIRK